MCMHMDVCASCLLERAQPTGREWNQPKHCVCGLSGAQREPDPVHRAAETQAPCLTLPDQGLSCCSGEWWPGTLHFVPDLTAA